MASPRNHPISAAWTWQVQACGLHHRTARASWSSRAQSFTNDAEGLSTHPRSAEGGGGPPKVAIAMEATGHYWYSLHGLPGRHGYDVAVLNPIQTAKQVTRASARPRPTASTPNTSPSA